MTAYLAPPRRGVPLAEQVALARAQSWAGRGGERFHVGVMWNAGAEVVAGSWQAYDRRRSRLWHALASVALDVGRPVRVCSWHADVFDPDGRVREAQQLAWIAHNGGTLTVLAGDFNSLAASHVRVPWSKRWRRPWRSSEYYDPDPYPDTVWYPVRIHQLDPTTQGVRGDRRADHLLVDPDRGRLLDAAVAASAPWAATTGHHPEDGHPVARRVDRIYLTPHFEGRVQGYEVIDTPEAQTSSDHLLAAASVDVADLRPRYMRKRPNNEGLS